MDNYSIANCTIGAVCIILGASYYKGFLSSMSNWVDKKYQRACGFYTLMNKLNVETITQKESITPFIIDDSDKCATIMYERMDQPCKMFVPYNRMYVAPMSQFKAELLKINGESRNITQQPGIPYLINAEMLGGMCIRVTNEETSMTYEYKHDTCPLYCIEVMNSDEE